MDERYVEACNYPGVLDIAAVESALSCYCAALGVERRIVRIESGWTLAQHPDLTKSIDAILVDFRKRSGIAARDASAALDARAARDALDARDALAARDAAKRRFASWCVHRGSWWTWDLSWLATTWFGARQLKKPHVERWSRPVLDAFVSGAWMIYWTEKTLYWIAKPTIRVEAVAGGRRLHCEDGPAVVSDAENLYFWHGVLVPAFAVVRPEWITLKHIRSEPNAEVRRVLRERYGHERYLRDTGARVVHSDVETAMKGAAPRVLLEDDEKRRWLVGTDGSTKRVYVMEVPPQTKTCRAAHSALCGIDEAKILTKS